jgi:predicted DNA-binding transcriptional regulator AlpA
MNPLNTEEAAVYLSIARKTLENWRTTGGGPKFIRYSPRCIRYLRSDLDTWIERGRRASTSDEGSHVG